MKSKGYQNNSSLIERARTSFKNGINGFLQNTGNLMNHVKKEMAQEDFSFSYPFKRQIIFFNNLGIKNLRKNLQSAVGKIH